MKHDGQHCTLIAMLWSEQRFFFLCRSTMEHVYGILLDEKFLYRSVHPAFVNTKWYEAWLERTLFFGLDHLRYVEPGCALVGTRRALQQPPHKTHSLFRICVVVLSSITSRSVAAAAASSLMRFSLSPSSRSDAANPWLESAFVTHFGCVTRHIFVCFPQSLVIACVFPQSLVIACVFPQSLVIACELAFLWF